MAHMSGAAYLSWAIFTILLGIFLVFHLWNFDRFRCLKWNHASHSGAFKRFMTYTYILTIPCLWVFAIGFAVIKYKVGYSIVPGLGIIPTPWQLWPESYKPFIFPLQLIFSVGWSLEMVTHLEELCFWLFLVNAGSVQTDWFRSLYFRTWILGSCVAVIYMPLVTIFTRSDPLKCEAFSFLAGSIGSLSLTFWFLPILWTFPKFLNNLKREAVDVNTVVRLTKFYELNAIRVMFRFLMTVPILILAIDGIRPHSHINESNFWIELFAIVAGLGSVISSAITLVIFFPRDIRGEMEAKDASRQARSLRDFHIRSQRTEQIESPIPQSPDSKDSNPFDDPRHGTIPLQTLQIDAPPVNRAREPQNDDTATVTTMMTFAPNRRLSTGDTARGHVAIVNLTKQNLLRHTRSQNVHPFIHNFTSPIDLMQGQGHSYGQAHPYSARGIQQC